MLCWYTFLIKNAVYIYKLACVPLNSWCPSYFVSEAEREAGTDSIARVRHLQQTRANII